MKIALLFLLITCSLPVPVFATTLFQGKTEDTTTVKALLELGETYEQRSPDSALLIYQNALRISQAIHYPKGAARSHIYAGIIYSDQGNYAKAIVHYRKAVEFFREAKNAIGEAKANVNIGNVCYLQGVYKESLTHYFNALKLMQPYPHEPSLPLLYTNLGAVYSSIQEFDKAILYHTKSLRMAESVGDSAIMGNARLNLGLCFQKTGKIDSATYYFNESLKIGESMDNPDLQYVSLNNLASSHEKIKKYDEALHFAQRAYDKALETEDPYKISSAAITLGVSYANTGNKEAAVRHFKRGIAISKKHNILENLAVAHDRLSSAESDLGQYKNALQDKILGTVYSDSVENLENSKEIGRLEGKYDLETELREKQIAEEKAQQLAQLAHDRRDRIQYFLISLALLGFFVALKLIRNFNISPKASQLITLIVVLLFFEFVLVFLDPYIDNLSGSIPVYKLSLNLVLALLIFPVHEWLLRLLSKHETRPLSDPTGNR